MEQHNFRPILYLPKFHVCLGGCGNGMACLTQLRKWYDWRFRITWRVGEMWKRNRNCSSVPAAPIRYALLVCTADLFESFCCRLSHRCGPSPFYSSMMAALRSTLFVRRPVRELLFSGLHDREAGIYVLWFLGGGVNVSILHGGGAGSCCPFSTGSCYPNFDQGEVAPTVSLYCFLFCARVLFVCLFFF